MEKKNITKRWVVYSLVYFLMGYVGIVLMSTGYEFMPSALLYILLRVYQPIVALVVAYLYFKKSKNDWPSRFVAAIGWTIIFYVLSVLLLPVVFGIPISAGLNFKMLYPHWLNIIGILVAGIAAFKGEVPAMTEEEPIEESELKKNFKL